MSETIRIQTKFRFIGGCADGREIETLDPKPFFRMLDDSFPRVITPESLDGWYSRRKEDLYVLHTVHFMNEPAISYYYLDGMKQSELLGRLIECYFPMKEKSGSREKFLEMALQKKASEVDFLRARLLEATEIIIKDRHYGRRNQN